MTAVSELIMEAIERDEHVDTLAFTLQLLGVLGIGAGIGIAVFATDVRPMVCGSMGVITTDCSTTVMTTARHYATTTAVSGGVLASVGSAVGLVLGGDGE